MVHVFNEVLARVTRRREGAESELLQTGVGLFWRAETAAEACLVAAAVA
jgi:ATP phosphoribosyltransferase regulatory subunit HisZ